MQERNIDQEYTAGWNPKAIEREAIKKAQAKRDIEKSEGVYNDPEVKEAEKGLERDLEDFITPKRSEMQEYDNEIYNTLNYQEQGRIDRVRQEQKGNKQGIRRAKAFENGMIYEINKANGLFGPTAEAYKTTEYDDIFNGTDAVIEADYYDGRETYPVRIAVDLTVNDNPRDLKDKIESILEDIERKKNGHFKVEYPKERLYYGDSRGLDNIPKLVLAVDRATYNELVKSWAFGTRDSESRRKMEGFRALLLEESRQQLRGEIYHIILNLARRSGDKEMEEELTALLSENDSDENLLEYIEEIMKYKDEHIGRLNYDYFELLENTRRALQLVLQQQKNKKDSFREYEEVLDLYREKNSTFQIVSDLKQPRPGVAA